MLSDAEAVTATALLFTEAPFTGAVIETLGGVIS